MQEFKEFIESRKTFVPPSGSQASKVVRVGEQPGRQEIRHPRRPFKGPAGEELDRCTNDAKILKSDCYDTNVIKDLDKPLKAYIDLSGKNPIVSELGHLYINLLKAELEGCQSNVIIAIGNIALFALCGRKGITSWRGSVLESTLLKDRKVIPMIHPATIIPPKNQFLNKRLITYDLMRVKKEMEFPDIRRIDRNIITEPSFDQAMGFIGECMIKGAGGHIIDYDIETSDKYTLNKELQCISFAWKETEAISIPFADGGGDYYTVEQEAQLMLAIANIMQDPNIRKRGHYLSFDNHFLLKKYGIKSVNMEDTMIAQKILFPDFLVRLEFPTTMYTDIPFYKQDGKFWIKGVGSRTVGWNYNALDSLACASIGPKQMIDLERQGNVDAYNRQRKLILPLTYMQERGTKVDVEGMKAAADDFKVRIDAAESKLNKEVGYILSANSHKQVCNHFYINKGLKPYTKKGAMTVDDTALRRIIRRGYKEAKIIQEIRGLIKRRSTYLNLDKIDEDGRIRCSYNPSGTRYSRISSSKNIFGTGTNMQNWPHELLKYLLADNDYLYYKFDLSQIENRIVAYIGDVTQMIEAFENGLDLHRLTAALIFSIPYDEVTTLDGTCPIGDGTHSQRFWGKKSNHAFNYDLGYKNFALQQEISENDGKWIHQRYHSTYPGVRQGFHAMVKQQLAKNRTLTNLFGRRTLFLDQWGDKLFREAYSCIPQGTTGDKINEHGVNYIYYNQEDFRPIELLNQVHDSIGFQIPLSIPWADHAEMLIKIKNSLEIPLIWKYREFIVPADLTIGLTMRDEDGIEMKSKDFIDEKHRLGNFLWEGYCKLKIRRYYEQNNSSMDR